MQSTATRSRAFALLGLAICIVASAGCSSAANVSSTRTSSDDQIATEESATSSESKSTPSNKAVRSHYTYESCDPNVKARIPHTTCEFALNAFYEYWKSGGSETILVYSPALGTRLDVKCTATNGTIRCSTSDHGQARFPQAAINSYTQAQADAYASAADLGPTKRRSGSDHPGMLHPGQASPDYSYSDAPSYPSTPSYPPASDRIPNYENGNGYPVQCADGKWSQSGGIQGSCSHHGGNGY